MKLVLDDKYKQILEILQQDCTQTVKEIALKIDLSFTATYERIKNLEEAGVIKKYVAITDREKLGLSLAAYCNINLKEQSKAAILDFEKTVSEIPEIVEMNSVSGAYDYMLKIVAPDIRNYNDFVINILSNIPNMGQYHSSIVLKEVKNETAFKIPKQES
ncbi:MAG: Lrp/AsnC family transcriptional regulator [Bacteroidales bacterium]|nr:Lrp/AsnC family transcriptional regulator [Bacteroidales bacterium]